MTRTVDDAIRDTLARAAGRTRYEGQEPRDDELMVAEIVRLRARVAELEAREAWLPIETAPKDGTLVLLWNKGSSEPYLARYKNGVWWNNHYGPREAAWHFAVPTHWRPLPAPPAAPET